MPPTEGNSEGYTSHDGQPSGAKSEGTSKSPSESLQDHTSLPPANPTTVGSPNKLVDKMSR